MALSSSNAQDALWRAAQLGSVDGIRAALDTAGVSVNAAGGDPKFPPYAPLQWAMYCGKLEAAEVLLAAGADATAAHQGKSIVRLAFACGDTRVLRAAIAAREAAAPGLHPVLVAASASDGGAAIAAMLAAATTPADREALVRTTAPVVDGSGTALHFAAACGSMEAVESLLHAGASVAALDVVERTPLWAASAKGHAHVVRALLDHGSAVDQLDCLRMTPLHAAALHGHHVAVELLISSRALVDQGDVESRTPLWLAAVNGHQPVVTELLRGGALVNVPRANGCSPLYVAAEYGFTEVARALLERGAAINQASLVGATPLHIAAQNGYLDVVQLLLSRRARSDCRLARWFFRYAIDVVCSSPSADGAHAEAIKVALRARAAEERALPDAAAAADVPTINRLVAAGADVNEQDADGWTALHHAAAKCQIDSVRALLTAGARTDLSDACRKQAVHVIGRHTWMGLGSTPVRELLEGAMSPAARYRQGKRAGGGMFGDVYAGTTTPAAAAIGMVADVKVAIKVTKLPPTPKALEEVEHLRKVSVARPSTRWARLCHVCVRACVCVQLSRHMNIVRIYDHWQDPSTGRLHIATEWAAGGDLVDYVQAQVRGGFWGPARALALMEDIAHGMAHAHAQRLWHRDIKPANVLVTGDGRALLSDFGGAKIVVATPAALTSHAGTPLYWSPELCAATTAGVDPAAVDVWALGCTFHAMLLGLPAPLPVHGVVEHENAEWSPLWRFGSTDAQLRMSLAAGSIDLSRVRTIRWVPASLVDLIARMLALDPAARPSPLQVAAELAAVRPGSGGGPTGDGHRVPPPPPPPPAPLPPGWRSVVEAATGRAYYYHEGTGMTTWDRP
jgi:ankyrin repeat protein/serine/threonine protein kinase